MNKKGLSFFWILLIVLVALGTFLIIYGNIEIPIYAKGDWSLNFIKNNYLPTMAQSLKKLIPPKTQFFIEEIFDKNLK